MMIPRGKDHRFNGRLLTVGFGCIGQGVLPPQLRHIEMSRRRLTILSADEAGSELARPYGVELLCGPLTPQNLTPVLGTLLGAGDFLLNLSVDVSSTVLVAWCAEHSVLYLDSCIEPWAGGHFDSTQPPAECSNCALREAALALRQLRDLGVRVIHLAERDAQVSGHRKAAGEFVNTESVDGFIGEGCQPAGVGWGTHKRQLPPDGRRHAQGSRAEIYLLRPGARACAVGSRWPGSSTAGSSRTASRSRSPTISRSAARPGPARLPTHRALRLTPL